MAVFEYEAIAATGKKVKNYITAASKQAAISELRKQEMNILSVVETKGNVLNKEIQIGRAVKLIDFVLFCRQFATLIKAGIQIDKALTILAEQTNGKKMKAALAGILEHIRNGNPLSQAMTDYPRIFPDMFISMVASGETSGNLDYVLERMADHYEKENKTIQKVKSAMTYPIVVLILAIGVVTFLLIKIVPTFAGMFAEQGAELPWITQFVMSASNAVVHQWWIFALLIVGIFILFKVLTMKEEGKYAVDLIILKIPIFGIIWKKASIARLTSTMSSLFTSAVPVLKALEIAETVAGNRVIAKVVRDSRMSLQEGKPLSEPFATSGVFPGLVVHMLSVGEETGQVDSMLAKVADFYETDVDQSVDLLKALIEPIMLLIVSTLVGIIVAAIMMPMFKMYDTFMQ